MEYVAKKLACIFQHFVSKVAFQNQVQHAEKNLKYLPICGWLQELE